MPATNNISRPYMAANPTSNKQRYSPATTAHVDDDTKEENESRPFHTDQYHQQINEHQDILHKAYNHPYFAPYTHHYNQPYFGEQQPVRSPVHIKIQFTIITNDNSMLTTYNHKRYATHLKKVIHLSSTHPREI